MYYSVLGDGARSSLFTMYNKHSADGQSGGEQRCFEMSLNRVRMAYGYYLRLGSVT